MPAQSSFGGETSRETRATQKISKNDYRTITIVRGHIPGGPFPSSGQGRTEQLLLTGENDLESTGVATEA